LTQPGKFFPFTILCRNALFPSPTQPSDHLRAAYTEYTPGAPSSQQQPPSPTEDDDEMDAMDAWDINIIHQVTQRGVQDVHVSEVDAYLAAPVVKLAQFGKGGWIWEVDAAGQRLPDHQQPPGNLRKYWIVSFIRFLAFAV